MSDSEFGRQLSGGTQFRRQTSDAAKLARTQAMEAISQSEDTEEEEVMEQHRPRGTIDLDHMLHKLSMQQKQHERSIEELLMSHADNLKETVCELLGHERQHTYEARSPSTSHPAELPAPAPPASQEPPWLDEMVIQTVPMPGVPETGCSDSTLRKTAAGQNRATETKAMTTTESRGSKGADVEKSKSGQAKASKEEHYGTLAKESLQRQSTKAAEIDYAALDVDDFDSRENYSSFRRLCRKIWKRKEFEYATTALIILNAGSIGVCADWAMKNIGEQVPTAFQVIEMCFLCCFSIELIIRIVAEGAPFFYWRNQQFQWNVFDSFVVFAAGTEALIVEVVGTETTLTGLRVLRLLRIVRVLRVVRVMKFFTELRVMVAGIANSLKALAWCIVLLMMVMYMFSLLFLQEVAAKLNESHAHSEDTDMDTKQLELYFGSLFRSMETLLRSATSGVTWGEVADCLFSVHTPLGLLYTFYFSFVFFCVFNVVTSVFVEHANSFGKMDLDNMILEEASRRNQLIEEMREIFSQECANDSDEVSLGEFMMLITQDTVQAYFRSLGLNVAHDNAGALFNLIDIDGSGKVGLGEFVDGCSQFVGQARQLDVSRLRHETRTLSLLMNDFVEVTLKHLGIDITGEPIGNTKSQHHKPKLRRLTVDKFEIPDSHPVRMQPSPRGQATTPKSDEDVAKGSNRDFGGSLRRLLAGTTSKSMENFDRQSVETQRLNSTK